MEDDFPYDLAVVIAAAALVIGFAVAQYRLIARTDGLLRWFAAAPSLIIALFVVLNVVSPSNVWPIALVFWLLIAFAVHLVVWLILRLVPRV